MFKKQLTEITKKNHYVTGRIGSQVIIPYRGDTFRLERLRLCGDLGQILFTVSMKTVSDLIYNKYEDCIRS